MACKSERRKKHATEKEKRKLAQLQAGGKSKYALKVARRRRESEAQEQSE